MPFLKVVIEKLQIMFPLSEEEEPKPFLKKLDTTWDIGGTLYAGEDWKEFHTMLESALSHKFGIPFKDNGNSFDTCLQFVAQ